MLLVNIYSGMKAKKITVLSNLFFNIMSGLNLKSCKRLYNFVGIDNDCIIVYVLTMIPDGAGETKQ